MFFSLSQSFHNEHDFTTPTFSITDDPMTIESFCFNEMIKNVPNITHVRPRDSQVQVPGNPVLRPDPTCLFSGTPDLRPDLSTFHLFVRRSCLGVFLTPLAWTRPQDTPGPGVSGPGPGEPCPPTWPDLPFFWSPWPETWPVPFPFVRLKKLFGGCSDTLKNLKPFGHTPSRDDKDLTISRNLRVRY
jgi:hypothetical protein